MKTLLLIVGIVSMIFGVLFLLFAALHWFGYYHVLDGTADLYTGLRRRTIIFFVIGIVLVVIGIVCLIVHSKI